MSVGRAATVRRDTGGEAGRTVTSQRRVTRTPSGPVTSRVTWPAPTAVAVSTRPAVARLPRASFGTSSSVPPSPWRMETAPSAVRVMR
ncbi:hypothetical protein [Azospirillum sp. INR13]|uniref:hypothetical protein n=1 Tax=Azospirillum sp. INR13 TaxID=2596919 RepID=UPI002107AADC|nr:hypothetical protein [Azospirillum sp. INR13]